MSAEDARSPWRLWALASPRSTVDGGGWSWSVSSIAEGRSMVLQRASGDAADPVEAARLAHRASPGVPEDIGQWVVTPGVAYWREP